MTKTNSSAKPDTTGEQAPETHAHGPAASDKPEGDDTCCGDACTSKTCKRALKALGFDLSDHSSHGH
jgi:hypothetical protein